VNGIVAQEHAEHSCSVNSLAAPDDDASESDRPSAFLLLREQPCPVATGVLAGEVPDLEVPGLRVLDPNCYCVGVVRVVLLGHQYGVDLFFDILFRRGISGEVPQVVLVKRFADNLQVLISD
jgi:hypothetical protein